MSHARARMATTGFLLCINRSSCFAGFGFAITCGALQAQENVFRTASIRLPSVAISPQQIADSKGDKTADLSNASKNDLVGTAFKPETSPAVDGTGVSEATPNAQPSATLPQDQASARNREPIVLPALTVPNTAIPGAGKGATPEDFVRGRLPGAVSLPCGADRYGFWSFGDKTWSAPVYCAQPLYFEDTMLERHGHERFPCLQPMVSGARFFSDIALLPYNAYLQRPLEERYSTGHYRPGSSAPGLRQRAPYDAGALRFQLLTTGASIIAVQP